LVGLAAVVVLVKEEGVRDLPVIQLLVVVALVAV
jgi:hypothetical protein